MGSRPAQYSKGIQSFVCGDRKRPTGNTPFGMPLPAGVHRPAFHLATLETRHCQGKPITCRSSRRVSTGKRLSPCQQPPFSRRLNATTSSTSTRRRPESPRAQVIRELYWKRFRGPPWRSTARGQKPCVRRSPLAPTPSRIPFPPSRWVVGKCLLNPTWRTNPRRVDLRPGRSVERPCVDLDPTGVLSAKDRAMSLTLGSNVRCPIGASIDHPEDAHGQVGLRPARVSPKYRLL